MQSGSPFYHFANKHELLMAVMEEGLRLGLDRTRAVLDETGLGPVERFRRLVRTHYGILHDTGSDFIPVMLYDWRSLDAASRRRIVALQDRYDAQWQRLIGELQDRGHVVGDARLVRLLILGAVNWTGRWYKAGGRLSLDEIAEGAARLFLRGNP